MRPDMVFGADLIAGFPTETEAMFASSLSLVDDCGLTFLHVFPYSAREGTPAALHAAGQRRDHRAARRRAPRQGCRRAQGAILQAPRGAISRCSWRTTAQGRSADFTPVKLAAE